MLLSVLAFHWRSRSFSRSAGRSRCYHVVFCLCCTCM